MKINVFEQEIIAEPETPSLEELPLVASAIRKHGRTHYGKNHGEIILKLCKNWSGKKSDRIYQHEQGFVDSDGHFLNRSDSYDRAVKCGQIKDDKKTRILVSEMVQKYMTLKFRNAL